MSWLQSSTNLGVHRLWWSKSGSEKVYVCFFPLSFQRVSKEPTTSAHGSFWATDCTDLWTQQGFRVICVIKPRYSYVHIYTSAKNYYWQRFLSFYMLPIIRFLPDDAQSRHYDNKSCVYKVSLFLIFLYQHPCIWCVCIYWFFIIKGPRLVPRGGHPKPSIFLQYSHILPTDWQDQNDYRQLAVS